jgi:hypothetical protein
MGTHTAGIVERGSAIATPPSGAGLKFRGTLPPVECPLPPLAAARHANPATVTAQLDEAPAWSPVTVAVPLFGVIWVTFATLAARITAPAAANVAGLAHLLATGSGIVALVLLTLSVVHIQVSGLRPRGATVGVVALGLGQGAVAAQAIGSGAGDLWSVGAWLFVLVGVAVPLAWVGGQFQRGVRRQRVERHASLTATWIARARHQANLTVQAVQRHDVRSMLFVIDGAARTLARDDLSSEQRASFAAMLAEGVERLGDLVDVHSEDIVPFAVDAVGRAVVHAERKAGRVVSADLPTPLTAVGRAADVAAVLRTLVTVTGRKTTSGVHLRGELHDGAVIVRVEPAGAADLPLLTGNWDAIWAETFKPARSDDDESLDLYVAARLLAEQGADVWSTAGRARFAVRLPVVAARGSQEET